MRKIKRIKYFKSLKYRMSMSTTPIEVNLNIEVDAQGEIKILSEAFPTIGNVVVATETLPAAALYDPKNGAALFEFWEDADINGLKAKLASSAVGGDGLEAFTGFYDKAAKRLASGLEKILCGEMNANAGTVTGPSGTKTFAAEPFNDPKYASAVSNYKVESFGRLALASYAHYMLGHVQATAAITNDKEFMKGMLSLTGVANVGADKTAAQRYADYAYAATVGDAGVSCHEWALAGVDGAGTKSDADLARRLVHKIVYSNYDAAATGDAKFVVSDNTTPLTSALAASIAKQVLGTDANRAVGNDNSKYSPEKHGLLKFFAGDVIYINIKLKTPDVVVSNNQQVSDTAIEGRYNAEQSYTVRVVLA